MKTKGILSYFENVETCNGVKETEEIPIEPLIGFLRHPKVFCLNHHNNVDKEYLFLLNSFQIFPTPKRNRVVGKKFLFDLGASLYNEGIGGASQQWFVEEYLKRGIDFDRIFGWEVTKHTPEEIYQRYPNNVVGKTTYFNLPADTDLGGKMSPIRMIKELVKPHDFLVIKIDIDNDPVELEIILSFIDDFG